MALYVVTGAIAQVEAVFAIVPGNRPASLVELAQTITARTLLVRDELSGRESRGAIHHVGASLHQSPVDVCVLPHVGEGPHVERTSCASALLERLRLHSPFP